jgi:hypothetical protein
MIWNDEAIAKIEAAIRALPVRTDGKAPEVDRIIELIAMGTFAGRSNTRPRARRATQKQTQADLRKLCALCEKMFDHVENKMRSPALRMLEQAIRRARGTIESG